MTSLLVVIHAAGNAHQEKGHGIHGEIIPSTCLQLRSTGFLPTTAKVSSRSQAHSTAIAVRHAPSTIVPCARLSRSRNQRIGVGGRVRATLRTEMRLGFHAGLEQAKPYQLSPT